MVAPRNIQEQQLADFEATRRGPEGLLLRHLAHAEHLAVQGQQLVSER